MLPRSGAARRSRLDRECAGQARSEDVARCTTKRGNAHRTEERKVLYLFHPWAGCIVHIHEVRKRPTGDAGRCSRQGHVTDRCLELPMWMFDSVACAAIRVEANPHAHIAALSALMTLLKQAASAGDSTHTALSNALIRSVRGISHHPNRGDSNATSSRSSTGPSNHSKTIRSLCLRHQRRHRTGPAAVADASRRDAPDGNKSFDASDPRPRKL